MTATGSPKRSLTLFPNLQFIYELHLARMEVSALAPGAILLEDFRSFGLNGAGDTTAIQRRSAYVAHVDGKPTDYFRLTRRNLTRAFNQYITHWFYPYKGKFHPQMVRGLANILGLREGDVLLDPFVGSGTTVVEGALLGLRTIGFDISPLCVLIASVKANAIHHLAGIEASENQLVLRDETLETWRPDIAATLADPVASFDLLARMIARSDEARRGQDYVAKVLHNRDKMLRSVRLMRDGCKEVGLQPTPARVEIADARRLPLPDASVDGVITSPPYSIALDYVANDAHALEALGYDLGRIREEFIGVRGSGLKRFDLYEEDMDRAYGEIARVLKPGRRAAVVLGNVTFQGRELDTVGNCIRHFERRRMHLEARVDKLIYGLYNVMQREWVLIFRKD
ncbi:MAG: DNA methyltransferase [Verrucomicrobiae bacterium]|nr:DNA methyltransferase [Verrucomicrobiae bacterium]